MDNSNPKYFCSRAQCYQQLLNPAEAVKDLTEAITLEPRNSEYHVVRGTSFLFLKQFDEAIKDYKDAI